MKTEVTITLSTGKILNLTEEEYNEIKGGNTIAPYNPLTYPFFQPLSPYGWPTVTYTTDTTKGFNLSGTTTENIC